MIRGEARRRLVAVLVGLALIVGACSRDREGVAADVPEGFEYLVELSQETNITVPGLLEIRDKLFERGETRLTEEQEVCALSALKPDPQLLLQAAVVRDASELGFEGNATASLALLDCAPQAFIEISGADSAPLFADDVPACMADFLDRSNPSRYEALVGLFAVGNASIVTADQQEPTIDLLATCMSAEALAQLFSFGSNSDPLMTRALDTDCVEDTFNEGRERELVAAMVIGSGAPFDTTDPEIATTLGQLFNCLSFTDVFVLGALDGGVLISDDTIACLTPRLDAIDMVDVLADGAPPETQQALDDCLTPQEAQALFG